MENQENKITHYIDLTAYYNKSKAIHDIKVNINESVTCRNFNINDLEIYNYIYINWFRGVKDLYAFNNHNELLAISLKDQSTKFGRTRVSKFIEMLKK